MKLTVFHLIPDLHIGGVLRLLQYNLESFEKERIANVVVYFNNNVDGEQLIRETGATLIRVPHRGVSSYPSTISTLLKLVRQYKPAIVHSQLTFDTRLAFLLSRLTNVRFVVTLHFAPEIPKREPLHKKLASASFVFSLKKADLVVAVSSAVKALYPQVSGDKVIVLHSGIADRSNVKGGGFIMQGSPKLLCVGRSHPVKGHEYLIDIAVRLKAVYPDFRLYLFTKTHIKSNYTSDFLKAIKEKQLEEHVIVVEDIGDQSVLIDLYRQADLYLLPSKYETLGLTILEAFSFGIPVVASNTGGIPEVVDAGYNGYLFQVGDAAEAVKFVKSICSDNSKKKQFSENARHSFLENFSAKASAGKLLEAYRSLLKKEKN